MKKAEEILKEVLEKSKPSEEDLGYIKECWWILQKYEHKSKET